MDRLPIQLSQASGVPFYRQIVDQVADLVRSGRLRPGEQVPSFRELSLHLRVSLITVRRAYGDLEEAGLLERRQGAGTFVADNVKGVSRALARAEARAQIGQAVARARRLGIEGQDLRRIVESALEETSDG